MPLQFLAKIFPQKRRNPHSASQTTTNYISVRTALYDFTPGRSSSGGELAVKRGQMLLVLDTSNSEWSKFKIKTNRKHNNGKSGIVPNVLTQEAQFISAAAACEGFIAQADGDLTIVQNDDLSVYCIEGDWALVKGAHAAGYVPRACIKLAEEMNQAVALFDFQATEPEHLDFRAGETLAVLDRTSKDWWRCENADHEIGTVPVNLVKLVPGSTTAGGDTSSTLGRQDSPISRHTDVSTIVSRLVAHGCTDLSSCINHDTFAAHPVFHGGYSDIYRGQLSDGIMVAVKILRVTHEDFEATHLKRVARELYFWSKCSHPNVLPLLGLILFRNRVGMVSPWMGTGSLPKYLKMTPGVNRYDMCHQICEGLSYLHSMNMIHGNLKGENILISNEGVALLGGFRSSQLVNGTMKFTQTNETFTSTLRWMAPELLADSSPPHRGSDVYSLGMTLYEAMTGQIPYYRKSDALVIFQVVQRREPPERPDSIPVSHKTMDKLWELLLRCWSFEPTKRPSAADVAEAIKMLGAASVLSRKMAARAIVSELVAHGCRDLSSELDVPSFGEYPVSHGGLSDIYQGQLSDSAKVAVKVLRVSADNISQGSKHLKASSFTRFGGGRVPSYEQRNSMRPANFTYGVDVTIQTSCPYSDWQFSVTGSGWWLCGWRRETCLNI
ncbi:unnamed protein product [Rhizoctonia solani]|uniref:mitogen-activated protein kinase kinase kinase n=1 Tax=Rhizoctonia solani TaxID=456999 RepID=A0A8H3CPP9_9AGAM|nr:unnamed protein product [Rhizoctonia solani]